MCGHDAALEVYFGVHFVPTSGWIGDNVISRSDTGRSAHAEPSAGSAGRASGHMPNEEVPVHVGICDILSSRRTASIGHAWVVCPDGSGDARSARPRPRDPPPCVGGRQARSGWGPPAWSNAVVVRRRPGICVPMAQFSVAQALRLGVRMLAPDPLQEVGSVTD